MFALCAACGRAAPPAVDGVLDLRGWDFSRDGAIVVRGDWKMYWHELVPPTETAAPDALLPLRRWNGLKLFDGRALPGKGWATYRLELLLPPTREPFTVVLDPIIDACRLWVESDGKVVGPAGAGQVGTTRETSRGSFARSQLVFAAADRATLTLQVSNFEHARGGSPGMPPLVGTASAVDAYVAHQRMADFFFIGLLFITGLHHLVLFGLRRHERASLWFAALCLLLSLRLYLLGRYLPTEIPSLPAGVPHRLETLSFFFAVPSAILFLHHLFPRDLPRHLIRPLVAVGVAFTATLLLPVAVYSELVPAYQLFTVGVIILGVGAVVRATARERDASAVLTLLGLTALASAALLDILRERAIVNIRFIAQYGISVFVICESALLALLNQRRAKQLEARNDEVQRLNSELNTLNDQLKRQIANRSHELSQAMMLMAQSNGPRALAAGDVVGDQYRVVAPIGEGGMGTVYRAERVTDGRRVALKLIRGGADPEGIARFAREAEVVAHIDHPNVVGILDFNLSPAGLLYLVMELVEGRSLEADRARFGDVAWALPLLAQLLAALEAIHAREVIHRDVKPSNLLVADGRLKLADFGVAQMRRAAPRSAVSTGTETIRGGSDGELAAGGETDELQITRAGMMIGSPMYMAPELGDGSVHASTKSDMFSFGLVAYEMLSGKRAYERPPVLAVVDRAAIPEPPSLASLLPALDARLAQFIDACFARSPRNRPDAATILAAWPR